MRWIILVSLVFALLAGCGGGGDASGGADQAPAFEGTFSGAMNGQPTTMKLSREGNRLRGEFTDGMASYRINGDVEGDAASGTLKHALLPIELPFKASCTAEALSVRIKGNYGEIPLELKRQSATAAASSGDVERDPRLVGHWRRAVIHNRRFPSPGATSTTYVNSILSADGRFKYGGGQSIITMTQVGRTPGTGMTGQAGWTTGEWKTSSGVLYSKQDGLDAWVPLGRYAFSGGAMVVYTLDGKKQLWERQ